MARKEVEIKLNGKVIGTEFVSEEFAAGVAAYDFKDTQELNEIMYAVYRCELKGEFDWCPADTRTLKQILNIEA